MTAKFTMKMYYYSIYPEPLSSITLVYLHFHSGNLPKSHPLCLFKAIQSFATILLLVIVKITSDYQSSFPLVFIKFSPCYHYHVLTMFSWSVIYLIMILI